MTSREILKLLKNKHHEDVFVPECKNGSTWFARHKRLDAWVMPRSWINLKFIGYEIKVSRSDFLKDDKYQEYLKMCNELYFVAPKGICLPDELPAEVGLLEVSSTGNRFFTRRKAAYREIEFPKDLFIYILMCRARIKQEHEQRDNVEYWKEWLVEKHDKYILGHEVSKKLKENYDKHVYTVREENRELKDKIGKYDEFKSLLQQVGVTDEDSYWNIRRKIIELRDKVSFNEIEKLLSDSRQTIERMQNNLQNLKQEFPC